MGEASSPAIPIPANGNGRLFDARIWLLAAVLGVGGASGGGLVSWRMQPAEQLSGVTSQLSDISEKLEQMNAINLSIEQLRGEMKADRVRAAETARRYLQGFSPAL